MGVLQWKDIGWTKKTQAMGSRALFLAIMILVLNGCKSKEYSYNNKTDRDSAIVVMNVKDSVCMRESLAIRGETIVYVRNIVKTINNKRDSVVLHEVQATKTDVPEKSKENNQKVIIFACIFAILYIIYKRLISR